MTPAADARELCESVLAKTREQIEITGRLILLLPHDRVDWIPPIPGAWPVGMLLGHLLDCVSGFCAVLHAFEPRRLAHLSTLRELPVNHRCAPAEAAERIATYSAHIDQGFTLLRDADLGRPVPTVFVEKGEPLLTLFLGNLEHLINHKHQLFTYLKLMGVGVGSEHLYRYRG